MQFTQKSGFSPTSASWLALLLPLPLPPAPKQQPRGGCGCAAYAYAHASLQVLGAQGVTGAGAGERSLRRWRT